ncbi:hypothetical protein PYCCODRAFT_796317 [Trametes coccinea BRFM310]|uniref:Uncharacterized protein n=1 Tax=Trametes coccinea (strain BRFM310) TaxID=1353009 RepID=A0A1Y2J127_TRAC3|nr:hypothetical protein PYCCODRAFT_796317 [Trametes coccinea BRFM310]
MAEKLKRTCGVVRRRKTNSRARVGARCQSIQFPCRVALRRVAGASSRVRLLCSLRIVSAHVPLSLPLSLSTSHRTTICSSPGMPRSSRRWVRSLSETGLAMGIVGYPLTISVVTNGILVDRNHGDCKESARYRRVRRIYQRC